MKRSISLTISVLIVASLFVSLALASTLNWQAIVSDGFGDANNQDISALEEFKGKLYAEATNYFEGATIWRSAKGLYL